jgi:hypothetical protein
VINRDQGLKRLQTLAQATSEKRAVQGKLSCERRYFCSRIKMKHTLNCLLDEAKLLHLFSFPDRAGRQYARQFHLAFCPIEWWQSVDVNGLERRVSFSQRTADGLAQERAMARRGSLAMLLNR